jgi:4a-hydroxytetrahydrobiopterin dehydratase
MTAPALTRQHISDATSAHGWRFVLGELRTAVPVQSVAHAVAVAGVAAAEAGVAASSLRIDLRHERVLLTLQDRSTSWVTEVEMAAARHVSEALVAGGLRPVGTVGTVDTEQTRSVQVIEIAVDAMNIGAVRPFWLAVFGYTREPGQDGPEDPIVDPQRQGPSVWFQQMDAPRVQRNRIHFDVAVPHDEAPHRVGAALAAGGTMVSDRSAPAFWVLADAEGNEVCVCTWQGRDPVQD